MAEILIAGLSAAGHITPLLAIAGGLAHRGDRVTVLTSPRHAAKVEACGARLHPLPPEADLADGQVDETPGREELNGVRRLNFDIAEFFVGPMPRQAEILTELFAHNRFDAVIVDSVFLGIVPFLLGSRAALPPVLAFTPMPLMIASRDTGPAGLGMLPSARPLGRLRNRTLTALSHNVLLAPAHRAANRALDAMNAPRLPVFILDAGLLADRYIVPTVPAFDYPRSDLPAHVRYVGAVHPLPTRSFRRPSWWRELNGDRPVVHVTQGTVDNADLGRLLEPTIEALGGEDVIVVATTGGRDVSDLKVALPSNTYVAEFIPHDVLLPKVDVMVSNGGYGAVQRALCAGVPLVIAGDTEDKPEVATRVEWSGAGINLRTGTPTPRALRNAIGAVLHHPHYRSCARNLQTAFAQRDGVAEIALLLDEVIAERRTRVKL
ncbi:MGT family glycosyltransferase [Mycolicibacterium sp. BK556]|uniref:glycosyltransferase n=1 Tax=unclassified Mycolicibacterium TaxID=2636767 RepID=UPI0016187DEE|nr:MULTISPECIES: nucleotide disphospho-sugar-binding domain-containing protein [unclassified Mycolicibacterium]MBB3603115.1 MGT family glycosyltransferase [Mycolicibacterium sp. BK556]MBB3633310.1 MGT family glycosyltransferase [Mycolicibacterium sp. BK607]MBB3750881.1 MGT family glycosyltransferase [Mycolicibacterium sp. BK634]